MDMLHVFWLIILQYNCHNVLDREMKLVIFSLSRFARSSRPLLDNYMTNQTALKSWQNKENT